MNIDFKIISEEDFELLCRDLLKALGARILSEPSRGPDRKKDLIIEVDNDSIINEKKEKIKYLVQCKHKAVSGKSVYENELGDIRSACQINCTNGYLLITSSIPSVSVSNNIEAIDKEGKYKASCWDCRTFQSKFDLINDPFSILERYKLLEPLENCYTMMKRILRTQGALPYCEVGEINEENIRGIVYEFNEMSTNDPTIKLMRKAYICTPKFLEVSQLHNLKIEYKLNDIHFVYTSAKDFEECSFLSFYNHIQSFKDDWYQNAICKISNWAPVNPTIIRMIHDSIQPLPYPPGPNIKHLLKNILTMRARKLDLLLVVVTAMTAAKFQFIEIGNEIYEWIKRVPIIKSSQQEEGAARFCTGFTNHLTGSLAKIDKGRFEFESKMAELFEETKDIQYKVDLIPYFTQSGSSLIDDALLKLKESNGDKAVFPWGDGIFFRKEKVYFEYNCIDWTVARAVEKHEKEKENYR